MLTTAWPRNCFLRAFLFCNIKKMLFFVQRYAAEIWQPCARKLPERFINIVFK